MAKFREIHKFERNWLDWCRLCANIDASINVQNNNVYMRIISKCFDIEIGFEEPELGAMLCKDCYCFIGRILHFVQNVNKVQPVFEILRHTEPCDQVDEFELRLQYGLQNKTGCIIETQELREEGFEPNEKQNLFTDISFEIKAEPSVFFEEGDLEDLPENDNWFENDANLNDESSQRRKRGRPVQTEVLDEELETQKEQEMFRISSDNVIDDFVPQAIKRKRGRPRKQITHGKNVALSRLLNASPKSKIEKRASKVYDDTKNKLQTAATCGICHKKLSSRFSLKIHIDRVHMNHKPFVCDCCGKSVKSSSELREHKLVHTDEKPFVCSLCNAAFKNKKRLNIHSQSHGEPSYECEICGKKLQTRAIWNKHKYVHSNERRFKCTICGTTTKNSTALKTHLLSHTGLRPYTCKYCHKEFACGVNCREHKKKMHPVEYALDDDKSSRIANVPTLNELRVIAAGMEKTAPLRNPRALKN